MLFDMDCLTTLVLTLLMMLLSIAVLIKGQREK